MKKLIKHLTLLLLVLLTTTTLLLAFNFSATFAQDEEPSPIPPIPRPTTPSFPPPEGQAVAIITATLGGTTVPEPGTYTYDNGEVATAKAVPWIGFKFSHWVLSGEFLPGHN